jgi:hypothetical protein
MSIITAHPDRIGAAVKRSLAMGLAALSLIPTLAMTALPAQASPVRPAAPAVLDTGNTHAVQPQTGHGPG